MTQQKRSSLLPRHLTLCREAKKGLVMPVTPISGLNYPLNSQSPNAPAQMADFLGTIDSRLIPIFTNSSVRDTKIPTPVKGQICYLLDVRHYTIYRDGQWKKITIPFIKAVPPDSVATPVPKWINNTTLSEITYLTTPVLAGKKYRIEGTLFFVTPAVDYVDASIRFDVPAGVFGVHTKSLPSDATSKQGINTRRQLLQDFETMSCGVVDKTPVFFEGVYSCTSSGNITISAAQLTLSAVELRLDPGSYMITKEF